MRKKLVKGSLIILSGLLFTVLSYMDAKKIDQNSLISYNDTSLYTLTDASTLYNIINNETAVVLIVNNKSEANQLVQFLLDLDNKNKVYVYLVSNDEKKLKLNNGKVEVIQNSSESYDKLLDLLGSYTDYYEIVDNDGNTYKTNCKKINTPNALFIKDGNIMFSYYIAEDEVTNEQISSMYEAGLDTIE